MAQQIVCPQCARRQTDAAVSPDAKDARDWIVYRDCSFCAGVSGKDRDTEREILCRLACGWRLRRHERAYAKGHPERWAGLLNLAGLADYPL